MCGYCHRCHFSCNSGIERCNWGGVIGRCDLEVKLGDLIGRCNLEMKFVRCNLEMKLEGAIGR